MNFIFGERCLLFTWFGMKKILTGEKNTNLIERHSMQRENNPGFMSISILSKSGIWAWSKQSRNNCHNNWGQVIKPLENQIPFGSPLRESHYSFDKMQYKRFIAPFKALHVEEGSSLEKDKKIPHKDPTPSQIMKKIAGVTHSEKSASTTK